jgi:ABC-2 type transport system permease protein
LVGGTFQATADALPFVHAVDAGRAALSGEFSAMFPDLWWVIGYAAGISVAAVFAFRKRMTGD